MRRFIKKASTPLSNVIGSCSNQQRIQLSPRITHTNAIQNTKAPKVREELDCPVIIK